MIVLGCCGGRHAIGGLELKAADVLATHFAPMTSDVRWISRSGLDVTGKRSARLSE
jgi:hypothetical protein